MSAFPEQRMSIITLGVADRDASTRFYQETLGFTPFMRDEITMFDLGGLIFGLWERKKLQADIGCMGNTSPPGACPNFAMAYNARSIEEVDQIFDRLRLEDVEIMREPHKADWGGYSGYFTDRDGYAWEVAFNPFWNFDENGRVQLPAGEDA